MIKATTQHGTYYIIDDKNSRAMRVKKSSNEMYNDGEWFYFYEYAALDREKQEVGGDIEVGKSIYFNLQPSELYAWRITTDVVSIEDTNEV